MILCRGNLSDLNEWISAANSDGAALLIDKEKNWTSFDAVAKLRGAFKIKKVGHAGTLDPLATGLIILCFGKFTKKIESFQALKKSYNAVVRLGATTKSYDAEFEEENIKSIDNISFDEIKQVVDSFIGEIEQTPPIYSARKVNGKALYKYARKGLEAPEIKKTLVNFYKIEILDYTAPYLHLDIECSKGSYIRSLANDIGEKLGCGAYMKELRRTAIGEHLADNALKISEISEELSKIKHSEISES